MKRVLNFFKDYIVEYLVIILLFAGVFFLAISRGSYAKDYDSRLADPEYYANKIFDDSRMHKVEVEIAEDKLQDLLNDSTEKLKYSANVYVDGEYFENVAFSTRGNVSLFMIDDNFGNNRYSYKINFKKYGGKDYHGLDKLLLNNLYSDATYLKDYTVYNIMRAAGVPSPLTSFTKLYINGELKGLYLALEDIDKSFIIRNQLPKDSVLYKPEALAHDHYKLKKLNEARASDDKPVVEITDANDPDFDYGGSDLVYADDNPESYPSIFNNSVSNVSPSDRTRLINSLKSLSPIATEDPSEYWDVTSLAKYFAANNFVINSDSYIGITAHNYYLLTSNSGNTLLPWDYNLAFQGITTEDIEESVINWPIDDPLTIDNPDDRPVWKLMTTREEYLEEYHAALQTLLNDYLLSGKANEKITSAADLIRPHVYSDPTRFFTIDEFEDGVNMLQQFISIRSDCVQKQLWGLIPRKKGATYSEDERLQLLDFRDIIDN